jgi:hypothetical protein
VIDGIALMTARDRTADLARGALPDAPTEATPEIDGVSVGRRTVALRVSLSLSLRRLADRVEPTQPRPAPSSQPTCA